MYTIQTEPERGLIRVALGGFWDSSTFARFKAEVREAALSLPGEPGRHKVIADASGAAIQSQEIADLLLAYMKGKTFRMAFVTGNAVIKMQARRLFREAGVIITETVEEAERALFSSSDDAPA